MNLEQRPVYQRIPFLELVPRIEPPQTEEGFSRIFEIDFMVRIVAVNLFFLFPDTTTISLTLIIVEWY